MNGWGRHLAQVGRVGLVVGPRWGRLCLPGVWGKEETSLVPAAVAIQHATHTQKG